MHTKCYVCVCVRALLSSKVKMIPLFQRYFGSYFMPIQTCLLALRDAFGNISKSMDGPVFFKRKVKPIWWVATSIKKKRKKQRATW